MLLVNEQADKYHLGTRKQPLFSGGPALEAIKKIKEEVAIGRGDIQSIANLCKASQICIIERDAMSNT
jgi:hypothetical protein